MELFEKLTAKAKASRQRIVLPEGDEPRTLTAADRILAEQIADIILVAAPVAYLTDARRNKAVKK